MNGNTRAPSISLEDAAPKGTEKAPSHLVYSAIGCGVFLLLWWLVTLNKESSLNGFNPADTFHSLLHLLNNQRFWESMGSTLLRLCGGLAIASIVGVVVGLFLGFSRRCQEITYIPFQLLRMISPLSWTPVAIIVLGVGSAPVYFLVAVAAVWPVIINTAAGVRSADPQWVALVQCLGAKDLEVIQYVLLRAALPSLLVGFQLALGIAWIVIVPAEMLGVASGLGYMILDFRDVSDYSSIMALILVIGALGIALDLPIRYAVKKAGWN